MGNAIKRKKETDPDAAWLLQNKEIERNPLYRYAGLDRGGKLIDAYRKGGVLAVQEMARKDIQPYLYNGGKGAVITKLEYIKWRRKMQAKATALSESQIKGTTNDKLKDSIVLDTKTDEELVTEFELEEKSSLNKVFDHEACWDLNKRGGVGETPLHLLFLMDSAEHSEVAKIILNMFPKLALDYYEADEYFGESCLHLAVIYGDFESVKLLVSNGANVNQRATGRFFLPEDQKNGRKNETSYEGFVYYGEYPLAFAACHAYMDIYDYLIDNGADPNLQDSFGNTSLHMVVISDHPEMYKYMVKHHKSPARTDIANNMNLTPLTLASRLGRHNMFKEMLEISSIDFWRYSNVTCSAYPLTEVDSISPSGEPNYNSALMIVINGEEDKHLDMLQGGVMRQLLDDKWKTFARRRFFERLILTFVHLSLISVAIYLRPASDLMAYRDAQDGVRFAAEIMTCLFCVAILILEVIDIGSQGFFSFVKNCKNAPDSTIFLFSCLMILTCIPFRFLQMPDVEDVILILAMPCSWFFLLFFARSVKLTGPFVTMIYKMCMGDLLRFGIIYLIFLLGFTQGFYFLFRDINTESFNTLLNTVMTLFQMTLGEFKYHDFDLSRYSVLTKLVFAVFMILVPILLLNMLIAMMGNTYQQVISKSEKEWRKQWAKIVVVLERGFSKKQLQRFHREYSIKLSGPSADDESVVEEIRALVVIKTSPKTKARQRKIAVSNWKKLGREIITQLKEQKKKGKTFRLQKVIQKPSSNSKNDGSDSEDDKKFTNITQQLAWERDIDLTKGQAFIKDPGLIENATPRGDNKTADGKTSDKTATPTPDRQTSNVDETSAIPNGKPRNLKKYVKKPNGTPKTSPKSQRQFPHNRVTPLPIYKQGSPSDESDFDLNGGRDFYHPPSHVLSEEDPRPPPFPPQTEGKYISVLSSRQVLMEEEEGPVVVKTDDGYVSHASHDTLQESRSPPIGLVRYRTASIDSRVMLDQWVDELIQPTPHSTPSKFSDGTPSKHKKEKKRKKDKKEKEKKDKHIHEERHKSGSSSRSLLTGSGVDESEL